MSFKHSSSLGDRLSAEVFTYRSIPAPDAAGANQPATGNRLWAAPAESSGGIDPDVAEQREKLAWKRGLDEGKTEARAEYGQELVKCREELAKTLRDFAAQRDTYFHRVEEQVVRLTLAIARKVLHREAQVDPLLLTGVLRVALEKIGAQTNTRLRVNPSEVKVWRDYFTQARESFPAPELIGDPELEPSRCVLETELGTTEISLETQLKEIEQGFLDLLAQRPGSL